MKTIFTFSVLPLRKPLSTLLFSFHFFYVYAPKAPMATNAGDDRTRHCRASQPARRQTSRLAARTWASSLAAFNPDGEHQHQRRPSTRGRRSRESLRRTKGGDRQKLHRNTRIMECHIICAAEGVADNMTCRLLFTIYFYKKSAWSHNTIGSMRKYIYSCLTIPES